MIDKANAIPAIMTRLAKLDVGRGIDLRTYKRDRSVAIFRTGDDTFAVTVDGFQKGEFDMDADGMRKLLKTLLKKEFPRSNKIRVYDIEA